MGRALIQASAELDGMACVAALEYPGHQALGMDAGMLAGIEPNQIILSDDAPGCANNADVWIEFSIPEPTLEHLAICVEHKGGDGNRHNWDRRCGKSGNCSGSENHSGSFCAEYECGRYAEFQAN